ncbi:MAG: endolytic transglycosylase MltG [bacterium]|nr:endolytic transglycosylase MltG [bacterium]
MLLLFIVAYLAYGLEPAMGTTDVRGGPTEVTKPFKIEKGERFREIAARLSRESLIRSISVFKLYALVTGSAQRLQPGVYELSPTLSVPELIARLTAAGALDVTVTIPEGTTALGIVSILNAAGVPLSPAFLDIPPASFSGGYFLDRYPYLAPVRSWEGLLFPDTYRFRRDTVSSRDVLAVLLATFDAKAWPLLDGRADWYERLTLASFLEREVPDFNDRTIVAGILMKRIQDHMPLQVDATISYAKCAGSFRDCPTIRVLRTDLAFDSPYNTYQHTGWTPTPISNPGTEAIRAAIEPHATAYRYYLSASTTGQTIFSKTLEEHNRNRVRYL